MRVLASKRLTAMEEFIMIHRCVTVQDLQDFIGASASTIARDLTKLHNLGRIKKVHGGAVAIQEESIHNVEDLIFSRQNDAIHDKIAIAKLASSYIEPGDFVYIDMGSTTLTLIQHLPQALRVNFFTHSLIHAKLLAQKEFNVTLIGGEIHPKWHITTGEQAVYQLQQYQFNKGFFGADAVSLDLGFCIKDTNRAFIKRLAREHSKHAFVLADASKLDHPANISFASVDQAVLITASTPLDSARLPKNALVSPTPITSLQY
ncbi:DeoR/GlpR family DNA-binding transcription regulator (plasmid) [Entomospira entomophila]|uniref:DeoR/GlpR transcriptional regulator n=1 Tax=Entomospira entomophila TaxID=2719988 RepID=A0A968KTG4_9SPIO|nr:DeoR/GlpR family DNA-binding transcription regulator [Entomospira entomophilus]NIZ41417.1 DeoR/GlpR transcriptional regulator [Entomospira entomophilus]WDI36367.1 DeoR/GlpR family DNA-binding transcription regulator [Entomospira entomophilus]